MIRAAQTATSLAFCLALAVCARAQDQNRVAAAEAKGPEVGEVRLRTMKAVTYAFIESETTFDQLGAAIADALPQLQKAAADGKLKPAGPFAIVYPQGSAHLTPDKPFKVHLGMIVADGAEPVAAIKVRKAEPFRAATVLYTGPRRGWASAIKSSSPPSGRWA